MGEKACDFGYGIKEVCSFVVKVVLYYPNVSAR